MREQAVIRVTASLKCRKTLSLATGYVYAWKAEGGGAGYVLIDPEGAVARPCTPEGVIIGHMFLDKNIGNVENPDPTPGTRRAFLTVASAIFQEGTRQGRLPDSIMRTYW